MLNLRWATVVPSREIVAAMPSPAAPVAPPSRAVTGAPSRTARVLTSNGDTMVERCELATTFARRLRGLMGRRALPAGEGLLLRPAGSVHTCFMRFPIDVVMLDGQLRVLRVAEAVRPWRFTGTRSGRAVLELSAGEAGRRGIAPGDVLVLDPIEEAAT